MSERTIKKIHTAESSPVEDLITYRALPTRSIPIDALEPFLFLNHHGYQVYPPHNSGFPFGPHPHKGFETVTFILKGEILHRDSSGHDSVIKSGGIQWMTAGKGVVHSELSSKEFMEKGGEAEFLQLWINLPSRLKQSEPKYTGLQKEEIPEVKTDDGKVIIHLISGTINSHKGALKTLTDVSMVTIDFKAGGIFSEKVNPSERIFLYVINGTINVNGRNAQKHNLVEFNADGESIHIKAETDAQIIFGFAKPNNEPVVARGPFVMNTIEEIQEAYQEYTSGLYGEL